MELQTLTSDINASRSRLAAARANKDNRLVRVLEAEITAAEQRRDSLLAHITTNLAGAAEPAQNQAAVSAAAPAEAAAVEAPQAEAEVEEPAPEERSSAEQAADEIVDPPAEDDVAAAVAATAEAGSGEGGDIVWDQLTPSDIERAQAELGTRRAEMLARHAEELKALEAEQVELEGLEKAINSFLQRLNKAPQASDTAEANAA